LNAVALTTTENGIVGIGLNAVARAPAEQRIAGGNTDDIVAAAENRSGDRSVADDILRRA